jgi:acetyl esterase/lipase
VWRYLRTREIAGINVAAGGDSAGGGLTICLINRLRASLLVWMGR